MIPSKKELLEIAITREQSKDLRDVFQGGDSRLINEKSREGWSCLVFERS